MDGWMDGCGQVMTGFIAETHGGTPTTLKRNGSDYTATIIGNLLTAKNITIWTDVDGVYSADPRKVVNAVCLESLSYHEAWELSYFGASVLHPQVRVVEQAAADMCVCVCVCTRELFIAVRGRVQKRRCTTVDGILRSHCRSLRTARASGAYGVCCATFLCHVFVLRANIPGKAVKDSGEIASGTQQRWKVGC